MSKQRLSTVSSIPHSSVNCNTQLHNHPCFSHPATLTWRPRVTAQGGPCRVPAARLGPVLNPAVWGGMAGGPSLSSAHALAREDRGPPTWEPLTSTLWMLVMVSMRLWASSMTTTWPCSRIPAAWRVGACSSI